MIVFKVLSLIVGTLLVLLGLISWLFIPIVPQIPFLLAGLALVGYGSPRARRAIEPIVKRLDGAMRTFVERLKKRLRRT